MTDSYNQNSINLASQENAGNSIYIRSLDDLNEIAPADAGGVRFINEPGRCVIVNAVITLPNDERIVVGNTTVLKGCDADLDAVIGNIDAALISGNGDGVVVTDLTLRNFSAGADSFCVVASNGFNPLGRASRVERVSVGGARGVLATEVSSATINFLSRASVQGVVFRGNTQAVQVVDSIFTGRLSAFQAAAVRRPLLRHSPRLPEASFWPPASCSRRAGYPLSRQGTESRSRLPT